MYSVSCALTYYATYIILPQIQLCRGRLIRVKTLKAASVTLYSTAKGEIGLICIACKMFFLMPVLYSNFCSTIMLCIIFTKSLYEIGEICVYILKKFSPEIHQMAIMFMMLLSCQISFETKIGTVCLFHTVNGIYHNNNKNDIWE